MLISQCFYHFCFSKWLILVEQFPLIPIRISTWYQVLIITTKILIFWLLYNFFFFFTIWLFNFGGLQNHFFKKNFWDFKITADGDCSHEIKTLAPWKKSYDQPRQHFKKQRHYFDDKDLSIKTYGFSSSHVWRWELDCKESWVPKNWCFQTVVLEKTLESPLDCKEIQPVHPKRNQSGTFIGKIDAEAETPILWPPDVKNWLIWKDPDAGKDWRWEEKGTTEDEMVGWHHWHDGHEFE